MRSVLLRGAIGTDKEGELCHRFISEERGAAMVEYGLIVALIAIMAMSALYLLGGIISAKLTQIAICVGNGVCS